MLNYYLLAVTLIKPLALCSLQKASKGFKGKLWRVSKKFRTSLSLEFLCFEKEWSSFSVRISFCFPLPTFSFNRRHSLEALLFIIIVIAGKPMAVINGTVRFGKFWAGLGQEKQQKILGPIKE